MWWFISKIFHVHPDVWEKDEPILTNMFFKGVGSTTNHQPQKWGDFPYLDPPLGVFQKNKSGRGLRKLPRSSESGRGRFPCATFSKRKKTYSYKVKVDGLPIPILVD